MVACLVCEFAVLYLESCYKSHVVVLFLSSRLAEFSFKLRDTLWNYRPYVDTFEPSEARFISLEELSRA